MWAAKTVPSSFILGLHVLVPGNAHLLVRYLLETTPWSARRTRARLITGVILAAGGLIDIFGTL